MSNPALLYTAHVGPMLCKDHAANVFEQSYVSLACRWTVQKWEKVYPSFNCSTLQKLCTKTLGLRNQPYVIHKGHWYFSQVSEIAPLPGLASAPKDVVPAVLFLSGFRKLKPGVFAGCRGLIMFFLEIYTFLDD